MSPITEEQLALLSKSINDEYASGNMLPSQAVKAAEGVNALSQAFGFKVTAKAPAEAQRLFQQNQPRHGYGEDEDGYGEDDYEDEDGYEDPDY